MGLSRRTCTSLKSESAQRLHPPLRRVNCHFYFATNRDGNQDSVDFFCCLLVHDISDLVAWKVRENASSNPSLRKNQEREGWGTRHSLLVIFPAPDYSCLDESRDKQCDLTDGYSLYSPARCSRAQLQRKVVMTIRRGAPAGILM
jgi:hypothetical protein